MDADSLILWLFKWWVTLSSIFWIVVGGLYLILRYATYRLTHPP